MLEYWNWRLYTYAGCYGDYQPAIEQHKAKLNLEKNNCTLQYIIRQLLHFLMKKRNKVSHANEQHRKSLRFEHTQIQNMNRDEIDTDLVVRGDGCHIKQ